jgi:hypothetical protein
MKKSCFQDNEYSFCGRTSTCQIKFNDFVTPQTAVDPTSKMMTPIIDHMVDLDSVDFMRI